MGKNSKNQREKASHLDFVGKIFTNIFVSEDRTTVKFISDSGECMIIGAVGGDQNAHIDIESLQASLSVKPTFSDLHAISVQNDSLRSQVAVLRAENFALQSKLSLSPSEREREQLRKVNKDLNEANTSISNELRILKKTVAILMKENTDLEDQLNLKEVLHERL